MILDMARLSPSQTYFSLIQTVIPRPIAWILTPNQNADFDALDANAYNLAPFSYFTPICSDPALVLVSIGVKGRDEQGEAIAKDTLANLEAGKKCVVHIANTDLAEAVTQSSATLAYGESEVAQQGLELVPFEAGENGDDFELARLKNCPVALACSLYKTETIGKAPQTLVYLLVEQMYIDDSIATDEPRLQVDADAMAPLARLGADQYAGLTPKFVIKRPS